MTTLLLIAAGAGLLYLILSVIDIRLALALFCALLPIYLIRLSLPLPAGPLESLPTTLLEIFFWILFAAWLLFGRGKRSPSRGPDLPWHDRDLRRWMPGIVLLLVGATVGVLVSPSLTAALGLWRAYFLEPILFFFVFVDLVRDGRTRRLVLGALGVTLAAVGVVAVIQKFTGWWIPNPAWQDEPHRRITGFYGFPNGVGLMAAPVVVLMSAWTIAIARKVRRLRDMAWPALAGLSAALGVAAIVFAVSEGAALGVAAGALAYGLLSRPLRKYALLALIAGCALTLAYAPLRNYASLMLSMRDDSWRVRQIVWTESLDMLGDRPVFGAGLAGYPEALLPYHAARHIEIFQYPHSVLLNFWTETGLIGLAGFVALLWSFFVAAGSVHRERPDEWLPAALIAATVALLAHGLVDAPYFKNDLAFLFWILIGLAASLKLPTKDIAKLR
ncbi:MAG: O-antigen ligase family protein [bacterium]